VTAAADGTILVLLTMIAGRPLRRTTARIVLVILSVVILTNATTAQQADDAGTFEGKFDLYYDVYQPPQGPPKPRKESGYLIPQGRDDLIITFRSNLATSKTLGCRMQFELEDLMLEVSFSSTNLDQYIKIKDAVTELVTSFIVRVAP
jgi:hypothetical protein